MKTKSNSAAMSKPKAECKKCKGSCKCKTKK